MVQIPPPQPYCAIKKCCTENPRFSRVFFIFIRFSAFFKNRFSEQKKRYFLKTETGRNLNGSPFDVRTEIHAQRLHRTESDKPLCDFSERKNGLTDRLSKLQKSLLDGKERTGLFLSPVRSLNSMILSLGIFYSSNSVMSVSVAFPSRMRKVLISYGANWAENVMLKEGRLISAPPEVPLHS